MKKLFNFILLIAFGAGLYWVYDNYFVKVSLLHKLRKPVELPKMQAHGIHLQAYDNKGKRSFELFGPQAILDEKQKKIEIKDPTLRLFNPQGLPEMILLARKGYRYQNLPEHVELVGDVEGTSSEGRKLFTNRLLYYPGMDKFVSPGRFKFIDRDHIVEGDSFWYLIKEERGEIDGNVKMRLHESAETINAESYLGVEYE